jgi:hypothetical protein
MIELTFLQDYAALFILIISFILIYAGVVKLGLGVTPWVMAVLSVLLALTLVSYTNAVKYLFSIMPYLTIILVITVLLTLLLIFAGTIGDLQKGVKIAAFVVAILVIVGFAFNQFAVLNHLLPGTPNEGLNDSLNMFKNWIYSKSVLDTILFAAAVIIVGYMLTKTAAVVAKK